MGQSKLQKLQKQVVNLVEGRDIDKQQAQKLIKDYIANGYRMKDIDYFMQTQSIDLFLKYFINYSYPQSQQSSRQAADWDTSKRVNQQKQMNKGFKNQYIMGQKIIQTACTDIKQKMQTLLFDLRSIYTSPTPEILNIIEKVKTMIITHLGIQSYRYYFYRNGTMKQTNSKILYLFDTQDTNKIYQYVRNKQVYKISPNQDRYKHVDKGTRAKQQSSMKAQNKISLLKSSFKGENKKLGSQDNETKGQGTINTDKIGQDQIKLSEIVEQIYPNSYCYSFQYYQQARNIHHVIIYQISIQKQLSRWKFSECLSQKQNKRMFYNIFIIFSRFMNTIFSNCQKTQCNYYKNFFSLFTLVFIELILKLQVSRIQKLLRPLKQIKNKFQFTNYGQLLSTKEKIVSKTRYWRMLIQNHFRKFNNNSEFQYQKQNYNLNRGPKQCPPHQIEFQTKQGVLFIDFDQSMNLEFIYTNQNSYNINFNENIKPLINKIKCQMDKKNVKKPLCIKDSDLLRNKCNIEDHFTNSHIRHFVFEYQKYMKNIKKNYEKVKDNFVMNLNHYSKVYVKKNLDIYNGRFYKIGSNYSGLPFNLSLLFKINKNDYLNERPYCRNLQEAFLQRNYGKVLIKRIRNENPRLAQTGWFKHFLKEQNSLNSQVQVQKRKNNMRLPKINKEYRISNFKTLYSLQQLREQIDIDDERTNVLTFSSPKLEVFVLKVFSKLEYFKKLPHQRDQFPNFIRQLHFNYEKNDNSFHNFSHAVNVMHSCYLLGKPKKNQDLLTDFDKFIIVFSGLCHDVGHTGFTNLFQIARQSTFAVTYNNKSPLENYHASKTFELLRKSQNNFLASISQKQFRRFRDLVINCILYTDIKEHFWLLKKFEETKNSIKNDDIRILAGMIVHASDFAGSSKVFQVCKTWSILVNQQFSRQFQEEGRLGIPQTPFMKDLNQMSVLSKNQSGFLKVIVQPLYKQLSNFYQDKTIAALLENVQANIKQWQKIMNQGTKSN